MTKAKQQQKEKPKIDEIVSIILKDKNLENALDLIAFIEQNKIKLKWSSTNCWQLYYKGKRIGIIRMAEKAYHMYAIGDNSWLFSPWDSYDIVDMLSDEKSKKVIWNNVRMCSSCGSCKPGFEKVVFGKKFENSCHSWLNMINPDKETVECIKQMIFIKKKYLDSSVS